MDVICSIIKVKSCFHNTIWFRCSAVWNVYSVCWQTCRYVWVLTKCYRFYRFVHNFNGKNMIIRPSSDFRDPALRFVSFVSLCNTKIANKLKIIIVIRFEQQNILKKCEMNALQHYHRALLHIKKKCYINFR